MLTAILHEDMEDDLALQAGRYRWSLSPSLLGLCHQGTPPRARSLARSLAMSLCRSLSLSLSLPTHPPTSQAYGEACIELNQSEDALKIFLRMIVRGSSRCHPATHARLQPTIGARACNPP